MPSFAPGDTIIVRDMVYGREFTRFPQRVIADNGTEIRVLLTPGTTGLAPALWVKAIRDQDATARAELMRAYARKDWELTEWTWQWNTRLAILYADRYFAIDPMWNEQQEFLGWYVNFQLPFVRTEEGVDTSDLHIDLLVKPDHSWEWKDEDEYAHAIQLGLVPGEWQQAISAAREQALTMVHERQGPFAEDWAKIPG